MRPVHRYCHAYLAPAAHSVTSPTSPHIVHLRAGAIVRDRTRYFAPRQVPVRSATSTVSAAITSVQISRFSMETPRDILPSGCAAGMVTCPSATAPNDHEPRYRSADTARRMRCCSTDVFQSGISIVEIDASMFNQAGIVKGLTKDDFIVTDQHRTVSLR